MDYDSPALQTYFATLQGTINRLSGNSAAIKNWCVTVVTAIVGLAVNGNHRALWGVVLIPLIAFLILDAYYLAMEREFRDIYRRAVEDAGTDRKVGLFDMTIRVGFCKVVCAIGSFSVIWFYGTVAALVGVGYWMSGSSGGL